MQKYPLALACYLLCITDDGHVTQVSSTGCPTFLVSLATGHSFGGDWRHRPGSPRAGGTVQLYRHTISVSANLWRQAIVRVHGGATRRSELATR